MRRFRPIRALSHPDFPPGSYRKSSKVEWLEDELTPRIGKTTRGETLVLIASSPLRAAKRRWWKIRWRWRLRWQRRLVRIAKGRPVALNLVVRGRLDPENGQWLLFMDHVAFERPVADGVLELRDVKLSWRDRLRGRSLRYVVTYPAETITVQRGVGSYFRPADVVRNEQTGEVLRVTATEKGSVL